MKAEVIQLAKDYLKAVERAELAAKVLASANLYCCETGDELEKARVNLKEALGIQSVFPSLDALCEAILAEDKPPKAEMMICKPDERCRDINCPAKTPHLRFSNCAIECYSGKTCIPVTEVPNQPKGC